MTNLAQGDIATTDDGQHWHVLSVNVERGYARVESVVTKRVFTAPLSDLALAKGLRPR